MKKVLVTGAGGFIGGHLVSKLIKKKYKVICADIKPVKNWLQVYNKAKNFSYDLKNFKISIEKFCGSKKESERKRRSLPTR